MQAQNRKASPLNLAVKSHSSADFEPYVVT